MYNGFTFNAETVLNRQRLQQPQHRQLVAVGSSQANHMQQTIARKEVNCRLDASHNITWYQFASHWEIFLFCRIQLCGFDSVLRLILLSSSIIISLKLLNKQPATTTYSKWTCFVELSLAFNLFNYGDKEHERMSSCRCLANGTAGDMMQTSCCASCMPIAGLNAAINGDKVI